jgi:hypothetical protein
VEKKVEVQIAQTGKTGFFRYPFLYQLLAVQVTTNRLNRQNLYADTYQLQHRWRWKQIQGNQYVFYMLLHKKDALT